MFIRRKITNNFIGLLEKRGPLRPVLLVEGARQVGKTTLVRQVLDELKLPFREVNLEEDKILCEKIDSCKTFDQLTLLVQGELSFNTDGNEVLFVDEAQESRMLGGFVRFMKEKWKASVILSGSSLSRIFREEVRFPVGRVLFIHVKPFSFEEFLGACRETILLEHLHSFSPQNKKTNSNHERFLDLLQTYMETGGLPDVVTTFADGGDWKKILENLRLGYYSDFRRIYGEEKQIYFVSAFKSAACLLGSPFKNSFVSQFMDGGKNQEIIQALSRLVAWKMLVKVEQKGPNAETHYHPKYYLFDVGMAKELREEGMNTIHLRHTVESLKRSPLGGLLENFVVAHASSDSVTGWKKSTSGSEVDFVFKRHSSLVPLECKSAPAIKNSHLGGLRDFMKLYKCPLGILAGLAPFEIRSLPEGKIMILPLYLLERWIEGFEGEQKVQKLIGVRDLL